MSRCWQTQLLALSAIYAVLTHSEQLLKDERLVYDHDSINSLLHQDIQKVEEQESFENKNDDQDVEVQPKSDHSDEKNNALAGIIRMQQSAEEFIMTEEYNNDDVSTLSTTSSISLSSLIQILNDSISLGGASNKSSQLEKDKVDDVLIQDWLVFETAAYEGKAGYKQSIISEQAADYVEEEQQQERVESLIQQQQYIDPYMAQQALDEIIGSPAPESLTLDIKTSYLQQVLQSLDVAIMKDPTEGISAPLTEELYASLAAANDYDITEAQFSADGQIGSQPLKANHESGPNEDTLSQEKESLESEASAAKTEQVKEQQQEKKGRSEERLMKQRTNAQKKRDADASSKETNVGANYGFVTFAGVVLVFSFAALFS